MIIFKIYIKLILLYLHHNFIYLNKIQYFHLLLKILLLNNSILYYYKIL